MTRFAAVGLASFALDCLLLWLVQAGTGSLLLAVVAARVVSGAVNFSANRLLVFDAGHLPWWPPARRYIALAGVLLAANYAMLWALTEVGIATLVAKVATEVSLFSVSFVVQRIVVFARRRTARPRLVIVSARPSEPEADEWARAA